ncbi:Phosphoribosylglycinamide formyltransferase [Syntrophomonas zehnderi OL-4]|uniref:Phosphoribosylglycinamide formyltransferase n=1 Tax=Syntrophomonas zehnderi OL-4 TaxID=690567 RepID=A0A0E3W3T3_9FIRM|nr:phosphoribosylglycinamide formyltransferase [Syntrophomonas zehnderi]CFY03371.1 Phosphoribosylglycinamide formyltransferase [Syntrophomonas zehnderi OL-4]
MERIIEPQCLQLAVMASGRGSNFAAIQEAIENGQLNAQIKILISDKEYAQALKIAEQAGITACFIDPRKFNDKAAYETEIVKKLHENNVDILVLAGFMRLVGPVLLNAFPRRILNIHPALLPSFPGLHAQRQAVDYGVKFSGCTVHLVDDGVDTGLIIAQAVVPVLPDDNEDTLAERILVEEHRLYPQVLQWIAAGKVFIDGSRSIVKDC